MQITLSFSNLLLLIITISVIIATYYLGSTLTKIKEFFTKTGTLVPEAKEVLKNCNEVLKRTESMVKEGEEAVSNLKDSSTQIKEIVDQTSKVAQDILLVFRPISMVAKAFRKGMEIAATVFSNFGDKNSKEKED
jgi:uncharacterized protein (UPF0333 family)